MNPPVFDKSQLKYLETKNFPIGSMEEYALPNPEMGSLAIGRLDGAYPWGESKWARNTLVDEWYVVREGEVSVTVEGSAPRNLKAGDWMYFPKGTWYQAKFNKALVDIPTIPAWTPQQSEWR